MIWHRHTVADQVRRSVVVAPLKGEVVENGAITLDAQAVIVETRLGGNARCPWRGIEELVGADVLDVGAVPVEGPHGAEVRHGDARRPVTIRGGTGGVARRDLAVVDEEAMAAAAYRREVVGHVAEQTVVATAKGRVLARRNGDAGGKAPGLCRGGRERCRILGPAPARSLWRLSVLGILAGAGRLVGAIVGDWHRLQQRRLVVAPVGGDVAQRSEGRVALRQRGCAVAWVI